MNFAWLSLRVACLSLFAASAFGACQDEASKLAGQTLGGASRLAGHTYVLEFSQGFTPVAGTNVRLSFQDEGEIRINAGCNHLFGNFSIDDDKLVVDGVGSTEIGCDAELHEQDEWLSTFVASRPLVALQRDSLTLTGDKATLEFLDREVASPDRPLIGSAWTVDTFIDGDSASNFPLEEEPTLRFDADGTVQVFTGCNEASGTYEQSDSTLTLASLQYTEKACSDRQREADKRVQEVASNGQVTFEIEERRLTITRGDRGLGATAD